MIPILELKKDKDIPFIVDVHDMIFEKFPHYFKNQECTKKTKNSISAEHVRLLLLHKKQKKIYCRFILIFRK
jgi:hypothetical protein